MYEGYNVPAYARLATWDAPAHGNWYAELFGCWSIMPIPVPEVLDENAAPDLHKLQYSYQGPRSVEYWCASVGGEQVAGMYMLSAPNLRQRWIPQIRVEDVEATAAAWQKLGGGFYLEPVQVYEINIICVLRDSHGGELTLAEPMQYGANTREGDGRMTAIELCYADPAVIEPYCELLGWQRESRGNGELLLRGDQPIGRTRPCDAGVHRWVCYFQGSERTRQRALQLGAQRTRPELDDREVLLDPYGVEFGLC